MDLSETEELVCGHVYYFWLPSEANNIAEGGTRRDL